jgi:mannitol 2-dehydrogenase
LHPSKGSAGSTVFEINMVPDPYPLSTIVKEQDYLYTLLSRSKTGEEEVRVIGAIIGYVNGAENPFLALDRLSSEGAGLVTMTITEKGYYWDSVAGDLDWNVPALTHDLTGNVPFQSAAGILSAALKQRYDKNREPLTIMSCDNFPSNGKALKKGILSFCRKVYPEIVSWIEDSIAFPCSMVDRITPNTTPETIRYLEKQYGIIDNWAVSCEDFLQWVLEDDFRLPANAGFDPRSFAEAGVQLVKDVEPYELMKMRLLNGSHSALSYLSCLLGYTGVAEAVEDPLMQKFIRNYYMEEITATLQPVPGIDLVSYKNTLIDRFTNRNIGDTVLRLTEDGSKKIPNAILKPLAEIIRNGGDYKAIALSLAGWARFLSGNDETGNPIPIKDPDGKEVIAAARKAREDPAGFLRIAGVQDSAEGENTELIRTFRESLEQLYRNGTKKTLENFCKGE